MQETYLGDGLYASFDGYMIKLRAPRDREDHEVYLEPEILHNFMVYISQNKQLKALAKLALEKNS